MPGDAGSLPRRPHHRGQRGSSAEWRTRRASSAPWAGVCIDPGGWPRMPWLAPNATANALCCACVTAGVSPLGKPIATVSGRRAGWVFIACGYRENDGVLSGVRYASSRRPKCKQWKPPRRERYPLTQKQAPEKAHKSIGGGRPRAAVRFRGLPRCGLAKPGIRACRGIHFFDHGDQALSRSDLRERERTAAAAADQSARSA